MDSIFCAIISSKNAFYLRISPTNIEDFKQAGMPRFPVEQGAGMPYYEVPEDVLEDSSRLNKWAARTKDAAEAAKKK